MAVKKICTECGVAKAPSTGFYMNRSRLYSNDEKMPICKVCFNNRYEELKTKYLNDEFKAMYHLCMNFDVYFNRDLVVTSLAEGDLVKRYMKNINSLPNWKGKIGTDSEHIMLDDDMKNEKEIEEVEYKKDKYDKKIITKEIRRKWGSEYTEDECVLLEDYYEYYFDTYNHDNDPTKLDHIREVCTFKLIIADAKKSKPVNYQLIEKFHNLIRQTLNSAGLSPSQRKVGGESHDEIFGKKIYLYETERPIPEIQDDLKDPDKFWKYIVRYLIKPFAIVKGLAKGKYSIEDGDNVELNKELVEHLDKDVLDNE